MDYKPLKEYLQLIKLQLDVEEAKRKSKYADEMANLDLQIKRIDKELKELQLKNAEKLNDLQLQNTKILLELNTMRKDSFKTMIRISIAGLFLTAAGIIGKILGLF